MSEQGPCESEDSLSYCQAMGMSRATASGLRAAAGLRKQLPTYSRLVHACNIPHTKGRWRTSAKGIVRKVSALAGETVPFSSAVYVFSSLGTTYTSIFPFSLVVTAVFPGSGSQPCLAAFPLLLFSFYLHLYQEPKALPNTLWPGSACVPLSALSCTSCLGIFRLSVPIPAAFLLGFVMVS